MGYLEEIVIEADGTVRLKHLSPELLEVALAVAPNDPQLLARQALWRAVESPDEDTQP